METIQPAIDRLAELSTQLSSETLAEASKFLDELAVALRQEPLRIPASTSTLPASLGSVLRQSRPSVTEESWASCAFQAGRAAANLVADCDEARAAVASVGYIPAAVAILLTENLSSEATKSLTISLLNLSASHHEDVVNALNDWKILGPLAQLANDTREQDVDQWLWNVIQTVTAEKSEELAPKIPQNMVEQFERCIDDGDHDILAHALQALDDLAESDKVPPGLTAPLVEKLADLAEQTIDDDSAGLQASALRIIVNLNTESELVEGDDLWKRMQSWLEGSRDDLKGTALLIFGNATRKAQKMGSLIPSAVPLLKSTTPDTVQHGLLGFLRNLSVLESNRHALFEAGVIDLLVDMGVWASERDRMGSVQGGAIVILKNLCRGPEPAERFLSNEAGVTQLLDLIKRTDDPPLRWEGTRVFANALRSLKGTYTPNGRIIEALVDLLRTGSQHPALVHEAVIALLLSANQKDIVADALRVPHEGGSGQDVLEKVASGEIAVPQEIRRNVEVLMAQLPAQTA